LIQYRKKRGRYRHDRRKHDNPEWRYESGNRRIGAYTDPYHKPIVEYSFFLGGITVGYEPPTHGTRGIYYGRRTGAYIDAPMSKMTGVITSLEGLYAEEDFEFLTKAYCRCLSEDDKFIAEFSFTFTRQADGSSSFDFPTWQNSNNGIEPSSNSGETYWTHEGNRTETETTFFSPSTEAWHL